MLKKRNENQFMSKFKIYTKDKKFYVTDNKINLLQFSLIIPGLIHLIFFKQYEFAKIELVLFWIVIGIMIISLFLNLTSFYRYKPLEGKIEGEIELTETEIIIKSEILKIDDIKNIKITNDDFLDFMDRYRKYIIIGRKSYGINKEINITLNNRKKYIINYQQDDNHDMQNSKELLKYYYSKGKIEMENLLYVLGIVDEAEKKEFKKTLR